MRAEGGAEAESIRSIKLNAPLDYATQGRAVTTSDYEVLVKRLFAQTQNVSVFGGEDGSFDPSLDVSSTLNMERFLFLLSQPQVQILQQLKRTNW